jgi:hypothetical protein
MPMAAETEHPVAQFYRVVVGSRVGSKLAMPNDPS